MKGKPKTTNLDSLMNRMKIKARLLTSIIMTQEQMAKIMMTTEMDSQVQMSKVSESARDKNGRDLYTMIYTAYTPMLM